MDWILHIEAAQREGKMLSVYAREHGLSAHSLYKARRRMRESANTVETTQPMTSESISPFTEVKLGASPGVAAPRARLWAHLPNGVNVEFLCTNADVELLVAMMDSLGRTACSDSTTI